jgi:hypothetical protein
MSDCRTEPLVDSITLLGNILRGVPRLPGALCRGQHHLFDSDLPADVADAAALCNRCPALQACAEWSSGLKHNQANGVIAAEYRQWCQHPSDLKRKKATA